MSPNFRSFGKRRPSRCRRRQAFFICRLSGSRFRQQRFGMTAGAARTSAACCRRWYGATSRKTNFILKGEDQHQLMDKETQLSEAIEAALDKKAQDAVVLELGEICSFTDFFLICTGTSTRHNQSIAEHIEETLKKDGVRPLHIEGQVEGEWILLDYVDFVVHIFSARAREFYDLERLWRAGKRRDAHELIGPRAL